MLTDMGLQGWELIVYLDGAPELHYLIFKRPLTSDS
jgi:hypothetical protein